MSVGVGPGKPPLPGGPAAWASVLGGVSGSVGEGGWGSVSGLTRGGSPGP